jgi:hypothetical protein
MQKTINLDLKSMCRVDQCAGAIALVAKQFKTSDSKGFEAVGIKSTVNQHLQSLLHRSAGAGRAPSEHNVPPSEANVSNNLNKTLQMKVGVT